MESIISLDSHRNNELEEDIYVYPDFEEYSESILSTSPSEKLWSQLIHPDLALRMRRHVYWHKRCLIENTINQSALLYVHCLSRRLEPRRVNALEFAWGMQCGTLNLNTRLNVFCLSPNFKKKWECFKWFLLPEDHIIHLFHDAAMNDQEFPDIGEGPYNYRFIAHPGMKTASIHRQTVFPDSESLDLNPEHFAFCSYPFETLGPLTCHLHPKFVICHIGWMVARADDTLLFHYADAHPHLLELMTMILQICNKWTRLLDKKDPKHISFLKNKIDQDEIISENWTRTGNGRIRPHMSQQRRHHKNRQKDVKRKDTGRFPHFVSTKKLRILEKQISPSRATELKLWDILSWRSSIPADHDDQGQFGNVADNDGKSIDTKTGFNIEMVDT